MAKVILLANHQPKVDLADEPCSKCDAQGYCRKTCTRAVIWWHMFAKQFGDKQNV